MPARSTFDYAIVRVVPRVERGELINVGAIVYCKTRDFLAAAIEADRRRLLALDPTADVDAIADALLLFERIARGDATAGAIAALPQLDRFHWLTSPRSTVVQTSAVHSGLCDDDPASALERVMDQLVRPPSR